MTQYRTDLFLLDHLLLFRLVGCLFCLLFDLLEDFPEDDPDDLADVGCVLLCGLGFFILESFRSLIHPFFIKTSRLTSGCERNS